MSRAERRAVISSRNLEGLAKPKLGVNITAIARELDDNGHFEAARTVLSPAGQLQGMPGRDSFVDAGELVSMIREVVKEELAKLYEQLRHDWPRVHLGTGQPAWDNIDWRRDDKPEPGELEAQR